MGKGFDVEMSDSLKGMELTKEGKVPMKETDMLISVERIDLFTDPVKSAIIEIFREGITDTTTTETTDEDTGDRIIRQKEIKRYALSVRDIANLSESCQFHKKPITTSQVYHHLSKLIEYGFVIKYGTLTTGKRTTDYYRRTAKLLIFANKPGYDEQQIFEDITNNINRAIEIFGFEVSKVKKQQLGKIQQQLREYDHKGFIEIIKKIKGDIANRHDMFLFWDLATLVSMQSDDWMALQKKRYKILFGDR